MVWGSESAAEKVGPQWEVGTMEDVVQALMETLVDPLLPLRISNAPPSETVQKSVAKQMHAVVLLYNYYHRKQKPELLFLDFVYFCKLAMVLRPPLIAFMKLMKEGRPKEPNGAEYQLSVTEKAIKDACDIAVALDASRDVPNIEGWPISMVAVLLIDSKEKHCMLQFGNFTKGSWSLIEKQLTESSINPEISAEEKVGIKRTRNTQTTMTCETGILQLAYDAMKDVIDIDSSGLDVLESHVTYSLSKEKSATCFYIMQCSGLVAINEQVPLKFLVESLQGPLAEKLACGFWKTTSVVEFQHLLPYVEFISCWLSGNTPSITTACKEELKRSRKSNLITSNYNGNDFNQIVSERSPMETETFNQVATENCGTTKNGDVTNESEKICDILDSAEDIKNKTFENLAIGDQKSFVSCPPRQLSRKMVIDDDNVTEKFSEEHDTTHSENKDASSSSARGLTTNIGHLININTNTEDARKKLNSEIRVYHERRKTDFSTQDGAQLQTDGSNLKVESDHTQHNHDQISKDDCDVTDTCNQTVIAKTDEQVAQFDVTFKCNIEEQSASALDQQQNALALLYRKRQELYSRICNMEDTLSLCEDNIIRIRDGKEIGLARECIKSLLSGNYHSLPEHGTQVEDKGNNDKYQNETHARLSRTYLPGKSSCQDLEYTCLKNNWRLPRYLTKSSDGKFLSHVILEGEDFELHEKGSFESEPCQARNSAAARMILVMHNTSLNRSSVV